MINVVSIIEGLYLGIPENIATPEFIKVHVLKYELRKRYMYMKIVL